MQAGTVLIIGGVAAGTKAAAKVKRENPDLKVVVLTREKHVSITGHEAIKILPAEKKVIARDLDKGIDLEFFYDKLVLATGASPFIPPVPGTDLKNIFTVRSVVEAFKVKELIAEGSVKFPPRPALLEHDFL